MLQSIRRNESPYIGAKRDEKIAEFNQLRRYKSFRVRGKKPVKQQLHMKVAIFIYRDDIKFVQFSRNLDIQTGERGPATEGEDRGERTGD